MKKQLFLMGLLAFTLSACENSTKSNIKADNTERNMEDPEGALTPLDQSEKKSDRLITKKIRKSLIEDSTLSQDAKNIKIITIEGKVTLRGPVNSDNEKSTVVSKAQNISGVVSVDDQLEVVR